MEPARDSLSLPPSLPLPQLHALTRVRHTTLSLKINLKKKTKKLFAEKSQSSAPQQTCPPSQWASITNSTLGTESQS